MNSEFDALLDLLQMLVVSARTGVLMALLALAAVLDVKTGRIPNWLVFGGIVYALAYNAFVPLYPRDVGILFALGGLAVGLLALLPLYLLRAMGAGDVKLMALVGAFIGSTATIASVLATLLAGGVLAVVLALRARRLAGVKMPYGVAIAGGTIGYLLAAQLGFLPWAWS
jgi:prepilin peptidase CpaA